MPINTVDITTNLFIGIFLGLIFDLILAFVAETLDTSIINLAVTLAQMGKRVIIVDADLRRPAIHHIFGLK